MRISDWSSDVCSSDLWCGSGHFETANWRRHMTKRTSAKHKLDRRMGENIWGRPKSPVNKREYGPGQHGQRRKGKMSDFGIQLRAKQKLKGRSEEHTSELQYLMRNSYAVFCLKKK